MAYGPISLANVLTVLGSLSGGTSSPDPEPEIPVNALLDASGNPILDTNGDYILTV